MRALGTLMNPHELAITSMQMVEAAEYELDSGFRNPTTVLIVFKPVNTVIPDGGIKAD